MAIYFIAEKRLSIHLKKKMESSPKRVGDAEWNRWKKEFQEVEEDEKFVNYWMLVEERLRQATRRCRLAGSRGAYYESEGVGVRDVWGEDQWNEVKKVEERLREKYDKEIPW